jgi:hypothetical protein
MLFIAPFLDDSTATERELIIYILIEHQSSVDPTIPFRVLSYIIQVWDRQRREWENNSVPMKNWRFRPILPIVFYTGSQNWNSSLNMRQLVDLPLVLERFIPTHEILFLNVRDIPSEQLMMENNPFSWILRVLQKENSNEVEFEDELKLIVEGLKKRLSEKQTDWQKFMLFLLAFIIHRRDRNQHKKLFDIVQSAIEDKILREEVEKMGKTMAQELIEEGMKIGLQKGLEQGKIEGKIEGLLEAIPLVLEIKFGSDGLALLEAVLKIGSIEKLEAIKEAIKISNNIEDIKKLI